MKTKTFLSRIGLWTTPPCLRKSLTSLKSLTLLFAMLMSVNVWGTDVTIASWGAVSLAANTDVNASSYQGTTAPKMRSSTAITTSATNAYYGGSAGGATITISGLPTGYKIKSVSFYTRASQGGNINVSYTKNGTSWTSAGSGSCTGTVTQRTVTFSDTPTDVTGIMFVHSASSGSLYFGTVVVTGEAEAGGGGGGGDWELVTDASTLKAGDILVIGCSSKGATAGDISNSIMASINSTFNAAGTKITKLEEGTVELTLGGTSGAWTFADSSKQLLGATAVKKVAWGSGTTTWSISISDGLATIQNGTSSYGRFLYNAGSPRFTPYTSATSATMLLPQLYRKPSSCTAISPTLSYTSAATIGDVLNPTLDKKGSSGAVTYSIKSGGTYASINASTGALTCSAAGTVQVQATIAAAGDYCEGTATSNTITISAAAYSITYNLDGGIHGTNLPTSAEIGTAFAVSPPTKTHYTFTGWQVTSGLNTSTAKWGPTSGLLQHNITSSTQKCIIKPTNDIYFKDLGANGASVTLTATWEENTKYTITFADNLQHTASIPNTTNNKIDVYSGETFTFPTIGDKTAATSGTCEQIHYHFMGWSTSEGSVSVGDIKTGTSAAVTAAATYYAVWAKEEL